MNTMTQATVNVSALNYQDPAYLDAYSRINALVVEGEWEAESNYLSMGELLPEHKEDFVRLAAMERKHAKGFQACGKNLGVTADMEYGKQFFDTLHQNFQNAKARKDIVTCLIIQSLIIECFAISAYNVYIPVADDFARKITENVVKDEYIHLNYGEEWLKNNFENSREAIERANAENLPVAWRMLNEVEKDASALSMDREAVLEDFLISYGETLANIGFTTREVMKMSAKGIA
jgi:fatty aldehyde decarbonylase